MGCSPVHAVCSLVPALTSGDHALFSGAFLRARHTPHAPLSARPLQHAPCRHLIHALSIPLLSLNSRMLLIIDTLQVSERAQWGGGAHLLNPLYRRIHNPSLRNGLTKEGGMIGPFDEKSSRSGSECDYRGSEYRLLVKRFVRAENSGQWYCINNKVLVCRIRMMKEVARVKRQIRYPVCTSLAAVLEGKNQAPSTYTPYSAKKAWVSDRVGSISLLGHSTHHILQKVVGRVIVCPLPNLARAITPPYPTKSGWGYHPPYSSKKVEMSDRVGFNFIVPSTQIPYSTKTSWVITVCWFVPHCASSGAPRVLVWWQRGQAVPQVNRTAQNTFGFSLVFLAIFPLLLSSVQLAILLSWFGSIGCSIGFVVRLFVTELV